MSSCHPWTAAGEELPSSPVAGGPGVFGSKLAWLFRLHPRLPEGPHLQSGAHAGLRAPA